MNRSIILRVDGSLQLGMGHVMRCIALAQGLREAGYNPIFVIKNYSGLARKIIRGEGFKLRVISRQRTATADAAATVEVARKFGATIAIADLNHPRTLANISEFVRFLGGLKDAGLKIVIFDGADQECVGSRRSLPLDLLIAPYIGVGKEEYKTLKKNRLLVGPNYFLFRREFIQKAKRKKTIVRQARRILISMGGGCTMPLNKKVVEAIVSMGWPDLELKITGTASSAPILRALKTFRGTYELIRRSDRMPDLISWADIAVISSGLTKYETALLGTPALVLSINQAQSRITDVFARTGCIRHLGDFRSVSTQRIAQSLNELAEDQNVRVRMSSKGQRLFDGKGTARVVARILKEDAK